MVSIDPLPNHVRPLIYKTNREAARQVQLYFSIVLEAPQVFSGMLTVSSQHGYITGSSARYSLVL